MPSYTVDPIRMFETPTGSWPLLSIAASMGVGANTQILAGIPAASGIAAKSIRVMGWTAIGQAGAGLFLFLDGSGGTVIHNRIGFPALAGGINDKQPIVECGYCQTTAGTGLFCTVEVAAVYLTVYYIAYIP